MKATRTIELGKGATLEITSELNVLKTEGGEGYVPHYPSVEEYEEAKEILKK